MAVSPGAKLAAAAALKELERRGLVKLPKNVALGPKTDEELLDAVEELSGHHIPRVTTCPEHGHRAPALTFCDLYFGRLQNTIWIGPRGGGKTANSGALHGAKCRWNPGYSSSVAGALERQSYRAYAEFLAFTKTLGSEIVESIKSLTSWLNDSKTEVLGATINQLNGPHPHLAQLDEADLVLMEIFQEFLNMAQGDDAYPAQQLLTSTRKKFNGLVQQLIREVEETIRNGGEPPWEVEIFCIFESMKPVHNCRCAPEEERKARLEAWGLDPDSVCKCDKVIQGRWTEGELKNKPRSFMDVCRGRAFKADGFIRLEDAHKRFKQLSRAVWEAQCECLTPNIEGVVHKWYGDDYILAEPWIPYPDFGPVYRTWDWGGQNPNAVLFVQKLTVDVGIDARGKQIRNDGDEAVRVLKAGSSVFFDEIYKTADQLPGEGDWRDLATVVMDRMIKWRQLTGIPLVFEDDFCDPAGFIAKKIVKTKFREMIMYPSHAWIAEPNFTSRPVPVAETVLEHIAEGEGGRIWIVLPMCPNTCEEYITYSWPEGRDERNKSEVPLKFSDHAMDATRYYLANLRIKNERHAGSGAPVADDSATLSDAVAASIGTTASVSYRRQNLGQNAYGSVGIQSPLSKMYR